MGSVAIRTTNLFVIGDLFDGNKWLHKKTSRVMKIKLEINSLVDRKRYYLTNKVAM